VNKTESQSFTVDIFVINCVQNCDSNLQKSAEYAYNITEFRTKAATKKQQT